MIIKRINFNNAEEVHDLVQRTNIRRVGPNDIDSGFLLYNYGLNSYLDRLRVDSEFSFGCFVGGKMVGCILASEYEKLKLNCELIHHEKKVISQFAMIAQENFVWGDQIAIKKDLRRMHYGRALVDSVVKMMRQKSIRYLGCMVSLSPSLNKAGFNFVVSTGFNFQATMEENGHVWGIGLRES